MRAKFLAMSVAMSGFMMTAEAADATSVNDAKPAAVATTSTSVLGAHEYAITSIAAFT